MRILLLLTISLVSLTAFSQSRQGKDRALFFAVNAYEHMTPLKNPVQNAEDIAAELEASYGFITEVVPNPSLETIEAKIATYKKAYAQGTYDTDGQLLIFFTGHGVRKGQNGYFMPVDALPARPHVSALEYDYWRDEINKIDCKHILVAVDACHSITFDPSWESKTDRSLFRPGEQFVDKVLLNHESYRARIFYTSDAVGNQTPDRSTFALKLLEGLRTHYTSSGYLTSSELFGSYLAKANPTPGGGNFGDDEPGSSFLFFRKPSVNMSDSRSDRAAWQKASEANTSMAYRQYLAQNPNGDFRPLAQQKLNQLEAEEKELSDWQKTKNTNTEKSYQDFINQYPNSLYKDLAQLKIAELRPSSTQPGNESTNNIDNLVFVKGGTFQMGSNDKEANTNEKPVHSVTVNNFYIGKTEVTNADFVQFLNAEGNQKTGEVEWYEIEANSASIKISNGNFISENGKENHPVIETSWYGAVAFCNWLSKKNGLQQVYTITGDLVKANWNANGYRLPTEAEWEFAARGGVKSKGFQYSGSNNIDEIAWYNENSDYKIFEIGLKDSNELGLHDMTGNVLEWCWDWYKNDYYSNSNKYNPRGPISGTYKIRRGGTFASDLRLLTCTFRNYENIRNRDSVTGFRICRNAP